MRRHRAAYLAPSATRFAHHQQEPERAEDESRIPLLVEVPHHQPPAVVSPPSSVGSDLSTGFELPLDEPPPSQRRRHSCRRKFVKTFIHLYHLLLDFLLLSFVCIMGLFFDVEVQVVKEDRRRARARGGGRGSGRVVIQTVDPHHHNSHHHHNPHRYRSTNLLRTPPRSLDSKHRDDGGEEYWYYHAAEIV